MKLDDILACAPFWVAVAFAVAGAEERPVGADSSLLILLRDPQVVRRVLELCLAPITLRIHCRQVCVDILFDVLDGKVAEVLHRTDVVAQVVADNHVRLRDDAMVFIDAETVEVGVQFLLLIA